MIYLTKEEWWPVYVPYDPAYSDFCIPDDLPEWLEYKSAYDALEAADKKLRPILDKIEDEIWIKKRGYQR